MGDRVIEAQHEARRRADKLQLRIEKIERALREHGIWTRSAHPCLFCGAADEDGPTCVHCSGTFVEERARIEGSYVDQRGSGNEG